MSRPSTATSTTFDEPLVSPGTWRALRRWGWGIVLLLAGWSCLVFVDETEFVIVETFGRITAVYDQVGPEVNDRGLHVKWPWPIGIARRFDRRLQLYDPPGREMFTKDKKNILVSSYVCWRIPPTVDSRTSFDERPVVRYFRGLGDVATAEARLDARARALLAVEVAGTDLGSLLTAAHPEAGPSSESSPLRDLSRRVLARLRQGEDGGAGNSADHGLERDYGVRVEDLGIHRLNLPEGNRFAVYERMRTERERMAERYRATGRAEKARIESQARRQSDEILAKAQAEAARIRGQGEAEALAKLQQAWAADPEFFEFQRALSAYSKILDSRTTLVLSTASRLFQLLQEGPPVGDKPIPRDDAQPSSKPAAPPADSSSVGSKSAPAEPSSPSAPSPPASESEKDAPKAAAAKTPPSD